MNKTMAESKSNNQIEIRSAFLYTVMQRGKPNLELFLATAECLGVRPDECVVPEDSDVGIEAATAADMKSLRFLIL